MTEMNAIKRKLVLTPIGVLGLCLSLNAQLTSITPQPIVGARMPALSPDGRRIAFVYRGDIWVSSVDKPGRATPLTQHVEPDINPQFSPDGEWVAFTSKRSGNYDIYAVP